jgi:GNAT superfamily N-acetyltransferase
MFQHTTTDDGWRITIAASNDEAYAVLKQDRVWNCFAIADLLPPFRQYTRISLAQHPQTGQRGALLIVEHPDVYVLSPSGAPAGVAALLARLGLPAHPMIQAQPEHWPLLAPYYDLPLSKRELWRMGLSAQTFQQPAPDALPAAERLTPSDLPALLALYDLFPTNHFRPDLLKEGLFYGIREGKGLVAAGGTHVIARPYGIAVLGNIFTHPERRGRGCAQAITSALVAELLAQGCQDIVLNVDVDNAPALRVYTKLGFQPHARWWSAAAQRLP